MTPIELLNALKCFIKENTKDIILQEKPLKDHMKPKKRACGVYLMRLPDKEAETKLVPYIVLQLLTGKDEQTPNNALDSECTVRIVVATYSENGEEGAMDLLNILTRIRISLLEAGQVGEQFLLKKPLEYIVYPDDTGAYYLGEMISTWEMPNVQRII